MTRAVRPRTLRRIASRERQRGYLGLNSYRRLAASALSGPSFYAQLTTSIVPDKATGSATPTFTRATTKSFVDWEGVVRTALSGEACFTGARRVRNFVLTTSEDFTNAAWTKTNGSISASGIDAPDGSNSAYTFTASAGAADLRNNNGGIAPIGNKAVASIWLRRRAGTGDIQLFGDGGSVTSIVSAVTTSWRRVSLLGTQIDATYRSGIRLITSGDAVDVWHAQMEDVTGQSNQNPSEYVSVGVLSAPYQGANVDGVQYFATQNGNTVASNVVTAGTGAAISSATLKGYDSWQAATNLALQSSTFSSASYTGDGLAAVNANATGPDGATSGATATCTVSTNRHRVFQTLANTAAVHTLTIYAKPGTVSWLSISDATGGLFSAKFDVTNVLVGATAGASFSSASIAAVVNGWVRIRLTATLALNNIISIAIGDTQAHVTDGTTTWAAAGTETMFLFGFQAELSAFATPYIATTTAAVTRNADVLTYPTSGNFSDTAGVAYAEYVMASAIGTGRVIGDGAGAGQTPLTSSSANSGAIAFDGTTQVNGPAGTPTAGSLIKAASVWPSSAGKYRVYVGGAAGVEAAYDGAFGIASIGIGAANSWINGTVRNVKIWTRALTDAQLQALTT